MLCKLQCTSACDQLEHPGIGMQVKEASSINIGYKHVSVMIVALLT